MPIIDKNMYDKLKKWWDYDKSVRPKNQFIMYINSHDRTLTNATIRKVMFKKWKEDIHGEDYVTFFSAENFYKNMRKYYTHVSELYVKNPGKKDSLEDIISDIPATCGWITLIVEDLEKLTGQDEKMQEMFRTFMKFAAKRSNIILVGSGDYRDVFSGCEYALGAMEYGLNVSEEANEVMISYYAQENDPTVENVTFENIANQRTEIDFYWDKLYGQLDYGYFDFEDFKLLFKETMEYIIPRVSKEKVYRKDLWLIENIGRLKFKKNFDVDGCKPWEYEAACNFATGLHEEIVNMYNHNDEFSKGEILIDVVIRDKDEEFGAVHISGCLVTFTTISTQNVCRRMDYLAELMYVKTYDDEERDADYRWNLLKKFEDDVDEVTAEEMKKVDEKFDSLMEGIKELADERFNKHK